MRRLATLCLFFAACGGCHMCSDCCDYSSPVADGPYAGQPGRAGSLLSGGYMPGAISEPLSQEEASAKREESRASIGLPPISPAPMSPLPPARP